MRWREWNEDAFAAARDRDVPLFVLVRAAWCPHSGWQERELEDERLVALCSERFVCVRVDKDKRPDLDREYAPRGWPSLAWIDHEGRLLARSDALPAEQLLALAAAVEAAWTAGRRAPVPPPARVAGRRGELDLETAAIVAKRAADAYDDEHGGFGRGAKFARPDALRLLMSRWAVEGDEFALAMVLRSVEAICAGELHDKVEGGFHRHAHRRDWSQPAPEKTLAANAELLALLCDVHQASGNARSAEAATGILRFFDEVLLSGAASPAASCTGRGALRRIERTLQADGAASAASALFRAAVVFGDHGRGEQASAILSSLLDKLDDERRGVHHCHDGVPRLPGRLLDQALVVRALVDEAAWSGDNARLATARRLVACAEAQLGEDDGAFADEPLDSFRPGASPRRRTMHDNAAMADALLALARMDGDEALELRARRALDAFAGEWLRHGHLAAGYALAVDCALRPALVVTIVGRPDDDRARAMRLAALGPWAPGSVVRSRDPRHDAARLAHEPYFRDVDAPRAYLARGRTSRASCTDAARLAVLMAHVERG